jgi:hypothetical protein
VQPTDPVIEAGAEAGEGRARDPEEPLEFTRRQLDPQGQTGPGRIQEEIVPKALVREQSAECPFHIPLTHPVLLKQTVTAAGS